MLTPRQAVSSPTTQSPTQKTGLDEFGGLGGEFTVTAAKGVANVTAAPPTEPPTPPIGTITLTETGANTGVFESQDDPNDLARIIKVTGVENDVFTIAYADSDVQVFHREL